MAYDAGLSERIAEKVADISGVSSKEMFGGIAFLIDGKMFVGVVKDELMVRVGKERHDALLSRPGARTMDFTGRPMIGYIFVSHGGIASDHALADWIDAGLEFTRTVADKKRPMKKSGTKK